MSRIAGASSISVDRAALQKILLDLASFATDRYRRGAVSMMRRAIFGPV